MEHGERIPYCFGHRVQKSAENLLGWEIVDTRSIDTAQPVVLCFGGNATINTTFANGMAKNAERFLGITPADHYVDVYSIQYGTMAGLDVGNLTQQDVIEITRRLILPRILDANGQKLSVEQACRSMRNINILSFCYGEVVVNRMVTYASGVMEKYFDYSSQDSQKVLSQILHICYAPIVDANKYTTNLEFKSFLDELLAEKFERDYLSGSACATTDSIPYLGCGELRVNANTATVFARSFASENKTVFDEHDMFIKRDKYWKTADKRADFPSMALSYTLALGVTNSRENHTTQQFTPLPSAREIGELIEPLLVKGNDEYREQIERREWQSEHYTGDIEPQME